MEFKTGQFMMWRGGGIFGKAIQFNNYILFGESGPTHTGIIAEVTDDQCLIFEATKTGFLKSWYNKSFMNERISAGVMTIMECKEKLSHVKEFCEKYEGIKYGWFTILVIAIKTLFNKEIVYTDGAKTLICSEGVSRVGYDASNKKLDFAKEYDMPFDLISPMHIYKSKQMSNITRN